MSMSQLDIQGLFSERLLVIVGQRALRVPVRSWLSGH